MIATNRKGINALLLAAGYGKRLRPLTLNTPKCLIKIGGVTMLEKWLIHLEEIFAEEVIVNTHYLHTKVKEFIQLRKSNKILIRESYEEKLLGTAGTLIKNKEFFDKKIGLLIHCDNYTNISLNGLIEAHNNRPKYCLLTMLTFRTNNPKSCGILKTNEIGVVEEFYEKNENPPGNLANGAVYAFDPALIDWISKNNPNANDFSLDIIPHLLGKIYTWHINSDFVDIGTIESYERAKLIANKYK